MRRLASFAASSANSPIPQPPALPKRPCEIWASQRAQLRGNPPRAANNRRSFPAPVPVLFRFRLPAPIGDEDVELVPLLGIAVRDEDDLLAVGRELGKCRETAERGHLLHVVAVGIH